MISLSDLLKAKIKDSCSKTVGVLIDIIATPDDAYPTLRALVVKNKKQTFYIPILYLENWDRKEINLNTIAKNIIPYTQGEKEMYLAQNLLDKQIVDTKGIRVVRVNDVHFSKVQDSFKVIGIDVGLRGLFRRLGVLSLDIINKIPAKYIDFKNIKAINGKLKYLELSTASRDLMTLHPADLANIVEELNVRYGSQLVKTLDASTAAKVLEEIQKPRLQQKIIEDIGEEKAARILGEMSLNELTDFLQSLPQDRREKVFKLLPQDHQEKIRKLLSYKEDTAGAIMSLDYISVPSSWTIQNTIDHLGAIGEKFRSLLFLYIVDRNQKFKGVVSLRHLIIAKNKDKKILNVAKTKIYAVKIITPIAAVAQMMTKYNLLAVAVLDKHNKLVGIIKADDIMRILIPEA